MATPGRPAAGRGEQLALSAFAAGDLVTFYGDRGRRIGRFVGIAARGPHRGMAEVAIGGHLLPERRVWVRPDRLAPVGRASNGGTPRA
jgi:hypothetical protein